MGTKDGLPATERRRTRWWRWEDLGGLAAPLVAIALWIAMLSAVAPPLGDALARIDARRASPARAVAEAAPCPAPRGALASSARPPERSCR